ncbi:MAG TPA: hypothetical protein VGS79_26815 [Puia sp.]|nr:hypothetical protein [Puia sp.]
MAANRLSADSIYRRIRGEKPVTLDELKAICEHYRLSLDELLQTNTDSILFQAPGIDAAPTSFAGYMTEMLGQFRYFNSFGSRELYYICSRRYRHSRRHPRTRPIRQSSAIHQ